MAKYHPLFSHIWSDPEFELLSPEDKLLFIYLFSNSSVTESGIYRKTAKKISDETGIGLPTVVQRLSNGCFRNIKYDAESNCVFVKNARRYNTGGNPTLIKKSILADRKAFPDTYLWHYFQEFNSDYEGIANGCPTVRQPYDCDSDTDNSTLNTSSPERLSTTTTTTAREGKEKDFDVVGFYEENMGVLASPLEIENLKGALEEFPIEWVRDAIREAVENNVRKWRYVEKILITWKAEGRKNGKGVIDFL